MCMVPLQIGISYPHGPPAYLLNLSALWFKTGRFGALISSVNPSVEIFGVEHKPYPPENSSGPLEISPYCGHHAGGEVLLRTHVAPLIPISMDFSHPLFRTSLKLIFSVLFCSNFFLMYSKFGISIERM